MGFRWISVLLGVVLMWANGGMAEAPTNSTNGPLAHLYLLSASVLVVYHVLATIFAVRFLEQAVGAYILVALDTGMGCLFFYYYGIDVFFATFTLPVLEAAYLIGPFMGLLFAILSACFHIPMFFMQYLGLHDLADKQQQPALSHINTLHVQMLSAYVLLSILLAWILSDMSSKDKELDEERRKNIEEKTILFRELDMSKEEGRQFCNKMEELVRQNNDMREQTEDDKANLTSAVKKVQELQFQLQNAQSQLASAQQQTQQNQQRIMSTQKREMDELKSELDEYQKTLDKLNVLLEALIGVNASVHRDAAVLNIIENLVKLVPSQTCLLYSAETQDGKTELFPDGGTSPYLEYLRNYSIKIGDGSVGWVAQNREPIRIDKEQAEVAGNEVHTLVNHEKSAIIVPLDFDGRLLGVLYLGRAPASAFTQEDFDVAVHFGRMASSTFHNALVYQRTLAVGIFDDITGLYNALYFDERLTEEVKRARRYEFPLSLILLDIDNFTAFNGTYGTDEGNQLLKDVSEILREHTRETDVPSRIQNDEFAVLLVESDKNNAVLIGERIRTALEMRSMGNPQRQRVRITVSGGVAAFPVECKTREDLVDRAHNALLAARKQGGNNINSAS